ncbi:MAG: ABC transporter permease, partial [Deltaproteobacteria bacterium]|nr:ABC transporter permease [Deltaproteobacteria bacterium]
MFMKKYEIFILPVVSVFAAMLVGAVLIFAVGENPLVVYWIFFKNSLFSLNGIGYTLFYATPLIFTGLSVAFGFRCGLFNIGAEGQLYVAAMAVTLSAIWMDGWSAWIVIPVCLTVSVVAGGIWGGIPGLLK